MASGGEDQVDNGKTCSICLEPFRGRHPKILKCFHTFCSPCLNELVEREKAKGGGTGHGGDTEGPVTLPCPTCRTCIDIPSAGVLQLQTNFYIKDDAEDDAPAPILCDLCEDDQHAQYRCAKCLSCFCRRCRRCHDRLCQNPALTLLKDSPWTQKAAAQEDQATTPKNADITQGATSGEQAQTVDQNTQSSPRVNTAPLLLDDHEAQTSPETQALAQEIVTLREDVQKELRSLRHEMASVRDKNALLNEENQNLHRELSTLRRQHDKDHDNLRKDYDKILGDVDVMSVRQRQQTSDVRKTEAALAQLEGVCKKERSSLAALDLRLNKLNVQVAFSVCVIGPFKVTRPRTIMFDLVLNKIGGGFNNHTGIFTAPVSGLYCFTATASPRNDDNSKVLSLAIMREQDFIAGLRAYGHNSSTGHGVVHMKAGQTVELKSNHEKFREITIGLVFFSGMLVQPDL